MGAHDYQIRSAVGGSLYFGWYIVATCFFVAFLSIPGRQGFGLFVTEMEPTFGWNRADISWVGSIGFLLNGAMQPIMGALFDRYGPRKVFGFRPGDHGPSDNEPGVHQGP